MLTVSICSEIQRKIRAASHSPRSSQECGVFRCSAAPAHFGSTGMFVLTALHLKGLGNFQSTVDNLLQDMHWKALRRLEQIHAVG